MFLRRLTEAITGQNWFTVVIEIGIVVVGIFIGLQVDDWNETRKARNDEQAFLAQLHEDLLGAEELSSRVRERRLQRLASLIDAANVVFGRADRDELTNEECVSIAASTYFNINVTGLPSYTELAETGRLGIIRDDQLRSELVALDQTRQALAALIMVQVGATNGENIGLAFPELIQMETRYEPDRGEVGSLHRCDLAGMRNSQAFLNMLSVNSDRYDAYVRDGLAPWVEQFDRVHQLVDKSLDIRHPTRN
jgi:hypothetical protein